MSSETQTLVTAVVGLVQAGATLVALVGLYVSHLQAKATREQTNKQIELLKEDGRLNREQIELLKEDSRLNRDRMEQSRVVEQMSQYQGALQLMFDWRSELVSEPKLAEHFAKEPFYAKAFAILDPDKFFHTVKLFHIFEYLWLLHFKDILQHDMWEPWSNNVIILIRQEKNRALWELLKGIGIFNKSFVAMVDSRLASVVEPAAP